MFPSLYKYMYNGFKNIMDHKFPIIITNITIINESDMLNNANHTRG